MHEVHELDLTARAASDIAARVRDGRSCAVDVARAQLRRIAEREAAVGAFQEHDGQRVLAEAGAVDSRADRFALPLAGVPVAVSDDIDVAGYPTRRGSMATAAEPARRDDELVKRLRAAGAVIMGKTRLAELGSWAAAGSALGRPRNPLDEALDPGGSAGGAAAAVAAGFAALAVAVDGGGGIRVPAARCGLVGVKPGTGRLPLPGGAEQRWFGLAATGGIARTARDAALLLAVLSGQPVDLDAATGPERIVLSLRAPSPAGRLRDHLPGNHLLGSQHRAAAIGAAARLRAGPGGAAVTLADPPYPGGLATQWLRRWQAGVALEVAGLPDPGAVERRTAAIARAGRRVLRLAPPGPAAPARWRARVLAWLDDGGHDLLVSPTLAGPPLPAGAPAGRGYRRTLLSAALRQPFTVAWNLAGLPVVVAPVLVNGRPVGVQLVGRPGGEAALLAAAARLEHAVVPAAEPATPRLYSPS